MAKKKTSNKTKKWVSSVDTESTFPKKELFKKDAPTIARQMASKKVSPKGVGSSIKMVQYFINRGGKGLSPTRKKTLERAKHLLQDKLETEKDTKSVARPKSAKKKSTTKRRKKSTKKQS